MSCSHLSLELDHCNAVVVCKLPWQWVSSALLATAGGPRAATSCPGDAWLQWLNANLLSEAGCTLRTSIQRPATSLCLPATYSQHMANSCYTRIIHPGLDAWSCTVQSLRCKAQTPVANVHVATKGLAPHARITDSRRREVNLAWSKSLPSFAAVELPPALSDPASVARTGQKPLRCDLSAQCRLVQGLNSPHCRAQEPAANDKVYWTAYCAIKFSQ